MGSTSIAHEAEGRMGYSLRGYEDEGNNCFSKIQLVGQKYRDKTTLDSKTLFSRHCYGFQSRSFSLLVGIQPRSSSTNQNSALIINHQRILLILNKLVVVVVGWLGWLEWRGWLGWTIRSSGVGNCLFLRSWGWGIDHQERKKLEIPVWPGAWLQVKLNHALREVFQQKVAFSVGG